MVLVWIAILGLAGSADGADYSEWSLPIPASHRDFWDDADGDGVRNGLEYLTGTDPMTGNHPGGILLRFGLTEEQGTLQPRLELSLPVDQPQDVLTRLEVSEDLKTWVPLANRFGDGPWIMQQGLLEATLAGAGAMMLRWTGDGSALARSRLFYRLSTELAQNVDTDGDGLSDQWERQYGLDPLSADAVQDSDGDGLNNLAEQQAGTHPNQADTDGDGIYDGCQAAAGQRAAQSTEPQPETGLLVLTP